MYRVLSIVQSGCVKEISEQSVVGGGSIPRDAFEDGELMGWGINRLEGSVGGVQCALIVTGKGVVILQA
jgi:hypothetical protein